MQAFYDEHSDTFLRHAGATFQAGLVPSDGGAEVPRESNLALAANAGVRPGDRVLDAGCGVAGPALDIVAGIDGVQIDGVTVSPVQARLAAERIEAAGLSDRLRVVAADYHRLPFADGTFDVVLFLESAGYSRDLPALCAEALRVLKPGGRLYVKDVFAREGPLTADQEAELAAYDATWVVPRTPPLSALVEAVAGAGFLDVQAEALATTSNHFIGAMFDADSQGVRLNAFGEVFFRRFVDLPVYFGHLRARAPA